MNFRIMKDAVAKQFQSMVKDGGGLYSVNIDKDKLWEIYLSSFPEGTNPVYKQRTDHDCTACRRFIRAIGDVVTVKNNKLISIWDVNIDGPYKEVADALAAAVKRCAIDNIFLHTEGVVGVEKNRELLEDKTVQTWEHFFVNLPKEVVVKGADLGTKQAEARSEKDVMLRSLREITAEAVDAVLELIAQNSLYRGEEQKFAIEAFKKLKREFAKVPEDQQEMFCWTNRTGQAASVTRIRNTAIGTLLVDLSEDKDLEEAVKSFEAKVAPTNYKRPTALITKAMIKKAQEKLQELGFASALDRRFATIEDITVNNILFADRAAKKEMNIFDKLAEAVPTNPQKLDRVEEISIQDFLEKVLPKAESVEVFVENRLSNNLVSLIAPVDPTAKTMFKWNNNFSWSYVGELTDSIKERVKKAGGSVTGDFRASLSWYNYDDLDLHLVEPGPRGSHIYFGQKRSLETSCSLDVDMNAGSGTTRSAVENITYPRRKSMLEGEYHLFVNNFCRRETIDVGFEVEMEFDNQVWSFVYQKPVKDKEKITVAKFRFTRDKGLTILESLPSTQASKKLWNLQTQTFQRVKLLMLSPNYWDERAVGNKHYFFMLDGCMNDGSARGFFNEFLTEELSQHRKVFEVVGSKMKAESSPTQLSGLGFSSTQRNTVLCRVKGAIDRVVKITF